MRLAERPLWPAIVVSIVSFIVYLFTLAPSVDFIDAGELATVTATLGIAHPTGYPLFTLVGWVFAHLPIAPSVILRLNLMAAFFTALGAGAMVYLMFEIASFWMVPREKKQKSTSARRPDNRRAKRDKNVMAQRISEGGPEWNAIEEGRAPVAILIASIITGLSAALSETWWSQSTSIEVYPLQLFLLPIILTFFLRMLRTAATERKSFLTRDELLFALTLGLAFSNHMTTVLLAPACLYMYFARFGFGAESRNRILRLAVPFLGALLLYLYLPIRSSAYPLMDWGHPATFGAFMKHVTGGQYKIWMFTGSGAAAKNWKYFCSRGPLEFSVGGFAAIYGLVSMSKARRFSRAHILVFTILLFFGCLFYAINYDIHDIDSYFLLAYLTIALWLGAGVYKLLLSQKVARSFYIAALAALVIPIAEGFTNFTKVDESGNYMIEDYTKNVLNNLPPNAIIFSTQWDFWLSSAFYYQNVEHLRPDVLVIDKAMLRDRPWYPQYLIHRAPEVMAREKPELDRFLSYLRPFDEGKPFDESAIGPAYSDFSEALIERNLDRPIYATAEMMEKDELFAPRMKFTPGGIQLRIIPKDSEIPNPTLPNLIWRDKAYRERNYYTDNARAFQAIPLALTAQRLYDHGENDLALQFIDDALLFKPEEVSSLETLSDRDREVVLGTNEKFSQMEQLKKSIETHTKLHTP